MFLLSQSSIPLTFQGKNKTDPHVQNTLKVVGLSLCPIIWYWDDVQFFGNKYYLPIERVDVVWYDLVTSMTVYCNTMNHLPLNQKQKIKYKSNKTYVEI